MKVSYSAPQKTICFTTFHRLVVQQPIDAENETFWDQFWTENVLNIQDVFTLIPASEIRSLRDEAPNNLATLLNKAIEKIMKAVDNSCRTQQEQQTGLYYNYLTHYFFNCMMYFCKLTNTVLIFSI